MTGVSPASGPGRRLPLGKVLIFSGPAASMGALAVAFAVYLPPFYASHVGLGAAGVASVFFTIRAIDFFVDPALGMVMDRTRSPLGRYRLWLMIGAPVFMIACYAAFVPPKGATTLYIIVTLLLVYVGQSMINLAQTAWGAVLAPSYDDRSRIFSAISFVGVIGAGVLLLLPRLTHVKSGYDPVLIKAMAVLMIVTAGAGIALAAATIPEAITADHNAEPATLGEYWAMVKRPEVLRIVFGDACLELGQIWMSALYLYFFQTARGFDAGQSSILLFLYIMAGLVGAPVLSRLAVRFGKHRTLIGCTTGFSLGLIGIFFVPAGQFWIAAPPMIVLGAMSVGFTILVRAMIGDVGDQVRLETGKQRIGLLFALVTMISKLTSAFSIGLSYSLLSMIGFSTIEGSIHSPASIQALSLVFLLGPIGFVMVGGLFFIGYKLDSGRHADIRAALEARDAAAAETGAD
jgi:GPH family glycoside/pentoside/hexuronide:cation symporter